MFLYVQRSDESGRKLLRTKTTEWNTSFETLGVLFESADDGKAWWGKHTEGSLPWKKPLRLSLAVRLTPAFQVKVPRLKLSLRAGCSIRGVESLKFSEFVSEGFACALKAWLLFGIPNSASARLVCCLRYSRLRSCIYFAGPASWHPPLGWYASGTVSQEGFLICSAPCLHGELFSFTSESASTSFSLELELFLDAPADDWLPAVRIRPRHFHVARLEYRTERAILLREELAFNRRVLLFSTQQTWLAVALGNCELHRCVATALYLGP